MLYFPLPELGIIHIVVAFSLYYYSHLISSGVLPCLHTLNHCFSPAFMSIGQTHQCINQHSSSISSLISQTIIIQERLHIYGKA